MWLRWVVSNLLSQVAEDKMRQAVEHAKNVVEPAVRRQMHAPKETPSDHAPERSSSSDLVVLFALGLESGGLVDRMSEVTTMRCATFTEHTGQLDQRQLTVCETGVGREAAAQATRDVIELHHPRWIVSAGFAGALTPELQRGHVVMPNSVVDQQHDALEVGFKIAPDSTDTSPAFHVGRLLTVDELVRHRQEKEQLADDYDAIACDMETIAVARVCQEHQVQFLSVRIVSDQLDDKLPHDVEKMLGQKSFAGKLGAATGALFQRPGTVKDIWKLRETAIHASDRLAKFLVGVLSQLEA